MTGVARNVIRSRRGGFSLAEVLLGIFILGIGIIAIVALFPAGIAQQRQSVDDIIGPLVANNAISVLRAKLEPADFGVFEEFGLAEAQRPTTTSSRPAFTVEGDWPWLRPGVARNDDGSTTQWNERGWYDIFSDTVGGAMNPTAEFGSAGVSGSTPTLHGIPYNTRQHHKPVFISQGARYYPQAPARAFIAGGAKRPRPQYVWECMFRRFQGRILVAIFVYRVSASGGGDRFTYITPPNPQNSQKPFLPHSLPLADTSVAVGGSGNWPWPTAWDASNNDYFVSPGLSIGGGYNPRDPDQAWQEPRQWLLDQNNNIHRVMSRAPPAEGGPIRVELVRPVPAVPPAAPFFIDRAGSTNAGENVVTNIWYMPVEVQVDSDGNGTLDQYVTLTPVFATVKEL